MEWKTHSVDINSPMIRSKLEVIFADYLSVDISATDLSFQPLCSHHSQMGSLEKVRGERGRCCYQTAEYLHFFILSILE